MAGNLPFLKIHFLELSQTEQECGVEALLSRSETIKPCVIPLEYLSFLDFNLDSNREPAWAGCRSARFAMC
jgi:hypothetical protein